MHTEEIRVYHIAETALNEAEVYKWLQELGVSDDFQLPSGKSLSDSGKLIGLAGKRCYKSFEVGLNPNITKIRHSWMAYLDNVLASGHGSVLEHASHTFAIENITRVCTGELNRHRAGVAISEGSMRFIRYEDIPYWLPISIRPDYRYTKDRIIELKKDMNDLMSRGKDLPDYINEFAAWELLEDKKRESRRIFEAAFTSAQQYYAALYDVWNDDFEESGFTTKKQITSMMRRIIPMGVCTGGVWTLNIRALRHVFGMRWNPAAEEEIYLLAATIADIILNTYPELFGDFELQKEGHYAPRYWKV